MAKKIEKNIVTALDVGTSKVVVLIAEVTPAGAIEIVGAGQHTSRGLKRGVVVDIESTVHSIQRAVQEAELMAGIEVRSVYTGIAGSHIKSLNSHGIVAIRDREVSQIDVERVLDAAKAVPIPADQKILHVLPQEFIIDGQGNIREPIGMAGVRLEARVHIVTGAVSAAQNLVKCIRRCGLEVNDISLAQLASSDAVLTEDEKALGVCLVDIGGGTTNLAIFSHGAIQGTAVIPIAGDQVTNDIAMALRTPTKAAEVLKLAHACALPDLASSGQMVEVSGVNERAGRKISTKALAEVVSARYEELFLLVRHELRRSGFEALIGAGMVLTGGASALNGAIELAETCFEMPVRQGIMPEITGLSDEMTSPAYSTAIGLLLHGFKQQREDGYNGLAFADTANTAWSKMKQWFRGNF